MPDHQSQPLTSHEVFEISASVNRAADRGQLLEGVNIILREAAACIDGVVDNARDFQIEVARQRARIAELEQQLDEERRAGMQAIDALTACQAECDNTIPTLRRASNRLADYFGDGTGETNDPTGALELIGTAIDALDAAEPIF